MGPPRSVVTILRAAVVLLVLSGAPVAHAGGLQVTDRQGKKPAKLSTDDVPLADTAGSPADASTALKGTTGDSIYEFFATVSRGTKTFDNTLISFVPTDHRASSYVICKESIDTFPVPVDNAVRVVDMSDESFAEAESAIGPIPFFGSLYELLYVDSNGFVTFGQPQLSFGTGLVQFFSLPMISAASTDLDPSRPDGESRIFFSQDIEQGYMAFTFWQVRPYSSDGSLDGLKSTFQVVIYNTGVIQLYFKTKIRSPYSGIIGLSDGQGIPSSGLPPQTDFTKLSSCQK